MLVIGHRGAKGLYPENTLGSVQKAIEIGVDMVEVDVHVCQSGEVVVIHDAKVDRTTNGHGYVIRKSLDQLKQLDAGQGEPVPTLREVLDLIDRRIAINIELKGKQTLGPVLKIVNEYIQTKNWDVEHFILSTFMRKKLKRLSRVQSTLQIGALLAYRPWGFIQFAESLSAYSVHLNLRIASPRLIDSAKQKGMKVFVWTVNEPDDIVRMQEYGVDGIFSDFPDRIHTGKNLP